jgi:ribosomal protein L3
VWSSHIGVIGLQVGALHVGESDTQISIPIQILRVLTISVSACHDGVSDYRMCIHHTGRRCV